MSCGGFSDGFREGVEVFGRPVGWSGADLEVPNRFLGDLGWNCKFRITLRVGFEVFCRPVGWSGDGLGADFQN